MDYAGFENWANKDELGKLQACRVFFEKNKPNSDVTWTDQSTGSEIASRFNAMFLVVASLNADKSDPRNQLVAQQIVDCMTAQRESSNDGHTLVSLVLDTNNGTNTTEFLPAVNPNKMTRYSDGTFAARDFQNHTWIGKTIEGHSMAIGGTLLTQEFEWNTVVPNFPMYRLVVNAPTSQLNGKNYFGDKPPIVVGQ